MVYKAVVVSILAASQLVAGHAAITSAKGNLGGAGTALGIVATTPRDGTKRNPFQADATRFRGATANTCGQTLAGGANQAEAGTKAILAANGGKLPQVSAGGSLEMVLHQVNGDGAGPFNCSIDATGAGTTFTPLTVTTQVAGTNGRNRAGSKTDHPLVAAIPAGQTCTGTIAGQANVCMVKCANARQFGGCVPVQLASGAGAAPPAAAPPAAAPPAVTTTTASTTPAAPAATKAGNAARAAALIAEEREIEKRDPKRRKKAQTAAAKAAAARKKAAAAARAKAGAAARAKAGGKGKRDLEAESVDEEDLAARDLEAESIEDESEAPTLESRDPRKRRKKAGAAKASGVAKAPAKASGVAKAPAKASGVAKAPAKARTSATPNTAAGQIAASRGKQPGAIPKNKAGNAAAKAVPATPVAGGAAAAPLPPVASGKINNGNAAARNRTGKARKAKKNGAKKAKKPKASGTPARASGVPAAAKPVASKAPAATPAAPALPIPGAAKPATPKRTIETHQLQEDGVEIHRREDFEALHHGADATELDFTESSVQDEEELVTRDFEAESVDEESEGGIEARDPKRRKKATAGNGAAGRAAAARKKAAAAARAKAAAAARKKAAGGKRDVDEFEAQSVEDEGGIEARDPRKRRKKAKAAKAKANAAGGKRDVEAQSVEAESVEDEASTLEARDPKRRKKATAGNGAAARKKAAAAARAKAAAAARKKAAGGKRWQA